MFKSGSWVSDSWLTDLLIYCFKLWKGSGAPLHGDLWTSSAAASSYWIDSTVVLLLYECLFTTNRAKRATVSQLELLRACRQIRPPLSSGFDCGRRLHMPKGLDTVAMKNDLASNAMSRQPNARSLSEYMDQDHLSLLPCANRARSS